MWVHHVTCLDASKYVYVPILWEIGWGAEGMLIVPFLWWTLYHCNYCLVISSQHCFASLNTVHPIAPILAQRIPCISLYGRFNTCTCTHTGKKLLGRSQVRTVAEKRREKIDEYCKVCSQWWLYTCMSILCKCPWVLATWGIWTVLMTVSSCRLCREWAVTCTCVHVHVYTCIRTYIVYTCIYTGRYVACSMPIPLILWTVTILFVLGGFLVWALTVGRGPIPTQSTSLWESMDLYIDYSPSRMTTLASCAHRLSPSLLPPSDSSHPVSLSRPSFVFHPKCPRTCLFWSSSRSHRKTSPFRKLMYTCANIWSLTLYTLYIAPVWAQRVPICLWDFIWRL